VIKLKKPILALFFGLATSQSPALWAQEIYSWVDENGVQHFSEVAPENASSDVSKLEIDGSQPAGYDPAEDRYNVAAQQAEMQALRDSLDESRKEKKEQRERELERQAANQVIYYPEPDYGYGSNIYYPAYPSQPPHGRPPIRPPLRPEHPIEPPIEEPAYSVPFRPPGRR
jgi:hypothetical protein